MAADGHLETVISTFDHKRMKTKSTPICVGLAFIMAVWIVVGLCGNWMHWSSSGYPDAVWFGRKMPEWKANMVAVFIQMPPWIILTAFLFPVVLWFKDRWCSSSAARWVNVSTIVLIIVLTMVMAQLSSWAMSPWSSRNHTDIRLILTRS